MKFFTTLPRTIVTCGLMAIGLYSHATSYTATQSGNWTDASIWQAGVAPPAVLSGNDFVIINSGITITMDQDETLNNSQAIVTVYGTLTSWHSLDITSGTLNGNGTIILHTLRMGTGSSWVFTGALTTDNLYNQQAQLTVQGNVVIGDTIGFVAGNVNLGQGSTITLADDAVLNIGAGTYSNYQNWHQNGRINLYYSRPGTSSMGIETTLVNLHDISVNMPAATDRLNMMSDLTISGALSLLGGQLNMNGHNITVAGTISSSGTGTLMASATSVLNVNGTSTTNSVAFTSGSSTLAALNINAPGGALTLSSDLTCLGPLTVQAGTLMLGSGTLTLQGTIAGAGMLSGTSASGLTLSGTGNVGTLRWASGGATVGNLTVNIDGTNGAVYMGNDLTVAGTLTLAGGYLRLNGKHLTLSGMSSASAGALWSDSTAALTVAGSAAGGMGSLKFASGGDKIHDLELNTSSNSWIALASPLSIYGRLILTSGNIDLGANDLKITGTDSVSGGSATSYVQTSGTGKLWIRTAAGGARILPIGTTSYYAPLRMHNNGSVAGSFAAGAHSGIYANGTSGADVSAARQGVIVSWDLESDIATPAATIEAAWSPAMESGQFNRNKVFISHYTNGAWDSYAASAAVSQSGMWSATRAGITSFSPFAVLSSGTAAPTGVREVADNAGFGVYPNPAINILTLNLPDAAGTGAVVLRDIIGNEVASYSVSAANNKVDISQLNPGVYIVSLNDKFSQKIVKQ